MKIAVFATGWNGEYLRDMYHGLENSQKEFHDSIHLYASFGRLGSGDSFNKSEFDFFELADMSEYDGFLYPSTTVKEGDVSHSYFRKHQVFFLLLLLLWTNHQKIHKSEDYYQPDNHTKHAHSAGSGSAAIC